ncbi:MAG TPA: chemotaxis protein CheW [Pseudomonadales bacterium]|nr:chemotaxis protein CheW [Pseudomonadales bacterium]
MQDFLFFASSVGPRLVPVTEVIEVIPFVKLQREPGNNDRFCGLLNYRGKVLPVFDFMACDTNPSRDIRRFLIVTHGEYGDACLVAQEVNHLISVEDDKVFPVQASAEHHFMVAKCGDVIIRIVSAGEFIQ